MVYECTDFFDSNCMEDMRGSHISCLGLLACQPPSSMVSNGDIDCDAHAACYIGGKSMIAGGDIHCSASIGCNPGGAVTADVPTVIVAENNLYCSGLKGCYGGL